MNKRSSGSLKEESRISSENRSKIKKRSLIQQNDVVISKKCGCPPPKKRFTKSMEALGDFRESSMHSDLQDLQDLTKSFTDRLDSEHGLPINYADDANLKFYHNSSYQIE